MNPASTLAVINLLGNSVFATTPDQTSIRLVSSVVSTPEPPTWAMMLAGFTGLGLLGARRAGKARAGSPA